jgi:DNA polymerase-3 subunit epsilon/oligoribonuclease
MLAVFLDSETNGLNYHTHKVIEIAFQIVDVLSGVKKTAYHSVVKQTEEDFQKSDPESLKINGFTWNEVALGKPATEVRQEILDIFSQWNIVKKKAVFICQNPSFDRVFFAQLVPPDMQEMLNLPYHWLDLASMHWAMNMENAQQNKGPFPWEIGLSKDKIAAFYELPPEQKPHRAMQGVDHLLLCYSAVVGFT